MEQAGGSGIKIRLKREKDATRFALQVHADLKSKGFDLSGGLSDDEVAEKMNWALSTYETV